MVNGLDHCMCEAMLGPNLLLKFSLTRRSSDKCLREISNIETGSLLEDQQNILYGN